jgi:hypothetical protein
MMTTKVIDTNERESLKTSRDDYDTSNQPNNGYGSLINQVKVSHHDHNDEEYVKLTSDRETHSNEDEVEGTATSFSVILGMTKGLIGCGALSLSNGIAMFTNTSNPSYIIGHSTLWIISMGIIFGYYCYLLGGQLSILTGHHYTYRSIWDHAVGHNIYASFMVSFMTFTKAFLAIIANASILTDTCRTLFQSFVVLSSTNHPLLLYFASLSRTEVLIFITLTTLTPLCFIKNIQLLAPFSVLGTIGIICTTIAMFIRYSDGTYREGGIYYNDLMIHAPQYVPNFNNTKYNAWTIDVLPYVCMVYEVRFVVRDN